MAYVLVSISFPWWPSVSSSTTSVLVAFCYLYCSFIGWGVSQTSQTFFCMSPKKMRPLSPVDLKSIVERKLKNKVKPMTIK